MKVLQRLLVGLVVAWCFVGSAGAGTKNVILMITDGGGFNIWNATSMYQGKWDAKKGQSNQFYDGPDWIRLAASTYPLDRSKKPTGKNVQDPAVVYDPARAWDEKGGYDWLRTTYTDSAAAATALSTGLKTFNNALNWSDLDKPISPTICEAAKKAGRSVGVITSVEWSHATPAGLSMAHNRERDNYAEIATEMMESPTMDVIMGAGNPDFDANGKPMRGQKQYKYVGGAEAWKAIEAARATPDGQYKGFRPISTKEEFEKMTSGHTPKRVLGTAQVATTLQQARGEAPAKPKSKGAKGEGKDAAKEDYMADDGPAPPCPRLTTVPSLATMSKAALHVLEKNPKGLFLMIEGGAVDWAGHKNQADRMIEEQADFLEAVQAVVAWVDARHGWKDTVVILTADHETGLIWGPECDKKPFQPLVDQGPGKIPGMKFLSKGHSNSLVPVFAKGAGSERLKPLAVKKDPKRGPYLDNTDIARVMHSLVTDGPAPR